jgi:hypothetical protein
MLVGTSDGDLDALAGKYPASPPISALSRWSVRHIVRAAGEPGRAREHTGQKLHGCIAVSYLQQP